MSSLPFKKEDLKKYHNDRDIVAQTARQVMKDFSTFGYDVEFPETLEMAYDSLFEQLAPVIEELLNRDASKLFSLLYTIDLSELKIRQELSEMKTLDIHNVITHLILDRELKKVLTRKYFSEK